MSSTDRTATFLERERARLHDIRSRRDDRSEEGGGMEGRTDDRSHAQLVSHRAEVGVVRVTEDGPLLVRGPIRLVDERGIEVPVRRRVNAICRCGRSATQPFCDGTHKIVPFSPRAVTAVSAGGPEEESPPAG